LFPLHQKLFVEANPIPVKWALQHMGLIDSGIRLPLVPLSAANRDIVRSALVEAGILNSQASAQSKAH
jgi:4-hydroxy-tetrahydrodipicolinate synthase